MPGVSPHDRDILRPLAARVRMIADSATNAAKLRRQYDHNDLKPGRPIVLCFPEGAWDELLPPDTTQCHDPTLHGIERHLRTTLYTQEVLRDDQAIEPFFNVGPKVSHDGFGVDVPRHHGENRGSFIWEPPIKDLDLDLDKLHFRHMSHDQAATEAQMARLNEVFGDLLPIRRRSFPFWTTGLTMDAIFLMGLEQLMMAMYDNPAGLHRLMAFLRDDLMQVMDWWAAQNLLTLNNESDYVGSGGQGYTHDLPPAPQKPVLDPRPQTPAPSPWPIPWSSRWGFSESQETVGVGPDQFAEFILPYQKPLMDRFGLLCYGCCEPVHSRIDLVMQVAPHLRRVSVSPWADQEFMAARLGRRCVFSRKPNPALVCVEFNEQAVRQDLRHTLEVARGCNVELVMKDTHTVQNQPNRLTRWVQIAREEIDRCGAWG